MVPTAKDKIGRLPRPSSTSPCALSNSPMKQWRSRSDFSRTILSNAISGTTFRSLVRQIAVAAKEPMRCAGSKAAEGRRTPRRWRVGQDLASAKRPGVRQPSGALEPGAVCRNMCSSTTHGFIGYFICLKNSVPHPPRVKAGALVGEPGAPPVLIWRSLTKSLRDVPARVEGQKGIIGPIKCIKTGCGLCQVCWHCGCWSEAPRLAACLVVAPRQARLDPPRQKPNERNLCSNTSAL